MSIRTQIFIRSRLALQDLAKDVSSITGIDFVFYPLHKGYEISSYVYENEHVYADLLQATEYENDDDLLFENYNYQLSVEAFGFATWQESEKAREDFAEQVFAKLKATNRYPMMMTLNMDQKLDEFEPT